MDRREAIFYIKELQKTYASMDKKVAEAIDLAIEALREKHQLSGETSTVSEKESVEGDLFNKSFWRMGMHDSNVIPHPMADTSTNEGDAESATTTDCISRADIEYHTQLEARGNGRYDEVEVAYKSDIESLPPVEPELVSGDTISKKALIQSFLTDCECKDRSEAKDVTCSLDIMLELIDDAPPVEPERPKGECRTCKWCSDHCCKTDDDFTRCPIEEHYSLPKDGYCHLYQQI